MPKNKKQTNNPNRYEDKHLKTNDILEIESLCSCVCSPYGALGGNCWETRGCSAHKRT